jgi:hypothetical protein
MLPILLLGAGLALIMALGGKAKAAQGELPPLPGEDEDPGEPGAGEGEPGGGQGEPGGGQGEPGGRDGEPGGGPGAGTPGGTAPRPGAEGAAKVDAAATAAAAAAEGKAAQAAEIAQREGAAKEAAAGDAAAHKAAADAAAAQAGAARAEATRAAEASAASQATAERERSEKESAQREAANLKQQAAAAAAAGQADLAAAAEAGAAKARAEAAEHAGREAEARARGEAEAKLARDAAEVFKTERDKLVAEKGELKKSAEEALERKRREDQAKQVEAGEKRKAVQVAADLLKQKCLVVANAFKASAVKRVGALAAIGKKEPAAVTNATVSQHFARSGIPLKCDPKAAFWQQPLQDLTSTAANVVNAMPVPGAVPTKTPVPTKISPTSLAKIPPALPVPPPVPTKVPATPQVQTETTPAALEQKRQTVAKAFEVTVAKRQAALMAIPAPPTPKSLPPKAPAPGPSRLKPAPKQTQEMALKIREVNNGIVRAYTAIKNNQVVVIQQFALNGVPTPSQSKSAFWILPLKEIRTKVARAVSYSYVQTDVKYGGGPVADIKNLRGLHPTARKEYSDVAGYDLVGAAAKKMRESRQASVNLVAAHFRRLGIPLDRPNPKLAFWRQPIKVIADQLARAVNTMPLPASARPLARPTSPVSVTGGWFQVGGSPRLG